MPSYEQVSLPEGSALLPVYDPAVDWTRYLPVNTVEVKGRRYVDQASLLYALNESVEAGSQGLYPGDIPFSCGLIIRPALQVVLIGNKEIPDPLTSHEFSVIHAIMRAPYKVHTRENLIQEIWDTEYIDPHTLDIHLSNAKIKLNANKEYRRKGKTPRPAGANHGIIKTIRSAGIRVGERVHDPTPLVYPNS